MIRTLAFLAGLLACAPALAQEPFFLSTPFQSGPLPQTIRLHDGRNIIGTGIVNYFPGGVRVVIRLNNGELLGTQVIERGSGKQTFYDVNGVESAPPTFKYEAAPEREDVPR
jgi:hypothetical protein